MRRSGLIPPLELRRTLTLTLPLPLNPAPTSPPPPYRCPLTPALTWGNPSLLITLTLGSRGLADCAGSEASA